MKFREEPYLPVELFIARKTPVEIPGASVYEIRKGMMVRVAFRGKEEFREDPLELGGVTGKILKKKFE